MVKNLIELEWTRPSTSEYPKIWRTFQARDLDSDKLVEYRIQDLPESRYEDAIEHMIQNYLQGEPVTVALHGSFEPLHIEDYTMAWRSILRQKCAFACFRAESDDIVGINMNFVETRNDRFAIKFKERSKSQVTDQLLGIILTHFKHFNFNTFEHYGAKESYAEFGLSVEKRYRGRGVGRHLLAARKDFCREFGIKISTVVFTSDFSNRCADQAGFELNNLLTFNEFNKLYPELEVKNIQSKDLTVKTLVC